MRNALNTDGTRMLSRMEWLSKLQILRFFSRLSAKRKQSVGKETSAVDDDEELVEEYASLTDEQMLEKASVAVESEIGVKHLVMYDVYNLCEIAYENRLLFSRLRCSGKRAVCKHFEIPSNLRDTKSSLVKGNLGAVARHRDNLQALVKEVDALKLKVEQAMFKAGKSAEDVGSWSSSIEEPIAEADEEVSRLEKWLVETNGEIEHRKHKDEEERKARAREEELKFEREQMEMKLEFERQLEETKAKQQPVEKVNQTEQRTTKLPKLQITKFNGTYEAWLPFWNKFQAEIDKANLASVTKFAYLKELVDPKVRAEIDGLPFTTEGYERAKNILIGEYGKTSEIVNAYVQNIANLPVITGTQPAPIHEFYKKLVYNVQSLETLGKLKDVTGNVRSVLDKLKGVKADLVRGQVDWQDWDFPQLIKALKSWKEINPIGSGADNAGKQGAKFRDREKTFHANETTPTQRGCVYCDATDHRAVNCDKFVTVGDRRKQLGLKQLCFNCTGSRHRASECKCRSGCQICSRRHHTSICDKHTSRDQLMTTTSAERKGVVYPMEPEVPTLHQRF
ncbi:myosin-6-like [Pocillopora verrucosa]|uniref:myosin-6-like n=1 Tax=Pocillopora verrucosa TaxID=203993 RepID=UPI0033416DA7